MGVLNIITYHAASEQTQKLYKSEKIVSRLSSLFAVLAVFISCIGLLGLAMFTVEQKTKEIGIIKVLGASITSLFALLSGEFTVLVGIAILIASSIAWWEIDFWSQDFAYSVKIDWWIILLAELAAIFIALITVSFQSIKTTLIKPIQNLRAE